MKENSVLSYSHGFNIVEEGIKIRKDITVIMVAPKCPGTEVREEVSLWEICKLSRPWNDPIKDIERKLTVQRDLFLILEKRGEILGSVMGGYDGHRGNVYYFGVHPKHQGNGYGKLLLKNLSIMEYQELLKD